MDEQVDRVIGAAQKKPVRFEYKKLDLVGGYNHFHKNHKRNYFESISQEKFNQISDKHLLRLESLKLMLKESVPLLGGVQANLSNGESFKYDLLPLDEQKHHTIDLKNRKLS